MVRRAKYFANRAQKYINICIRAKKVYFCPKFANYCPLGVEKSKRYDI